MLNVIRIIVLIGYLLINFYLMAFNWQVYTVSINVNYGFGTFAAPIVMTTFIIGLVAIILEWLLTYAIQLENDNTVKDLHGKIKHLEYEKKFKEYELKIMEKEDELKQLRLNPPSENSEPNQAEQEEQSS